MRMRWLVGTGLVVLLLPAAWAAAQEYVGVDKCKMCHKVEHQSWSQTKHAKAFEALKPEEQAKAECLKCHATGGKAEFQGVQCESCHGPGSEYKSLKVMKDHEASVAAGLLVPTEATCKSCHEKAPHEVPAFDYAKMQAGGVHEVKKTE